MVTLLLGPFEVRDGSSPVRLGGRKPRALLARLALDANRTVPAERLIEGLWGEDVPDGKVTDFKRAVGAKPDETVVFAWIEWPSKEVRDAANKRMMEDPEMKSMDMPFDGKRMIFGGFDVMFDTAPGKR